MDEKIVVDLLGVRKSGAERMAIAHPQTNLLTDAIPVTVTIAQNSK